MQDDVLQALVDLAATRPEGQWPEQLDLNRFHQELREAAPASHAVTDVSVARKIRDDVAAILLDGSDSEAYAALNGLVTEHEVMPMVSATGMHYRSARADVVSSVWAQIAGPILVAVASGVRDRVRRCASSPCITPFLDSPHGGREYCCGRCATRARVRRHRAERVR